MKAIYILLTRSGTLLSKLVYAVTGVGYTHASMAFDAELTCPSAGHKSFLSKAFGHKTEISAFLSAALAFCSQLW